MIPYKQLSGVVFVLVFAAMNANAQGLQELERDAEGFRIGPNDVVTFGELRLHSVDDGNRKRLIHQGDVVADSVRIDDGTYILESGALTTLRLTLGDPQTTELAATNEFGTLMIGAAPNPMWAVLDAPYSLDQLYIRSTLGNLKPIENSQMAEVPFETVTSNTPFLISFKSDTEPVVVQEPLSLPVRFSADELVAGDVLISINEASRTLESQFRQLGGVVNVTQLELCVPPLVSIPIVDAANGVTNKVLYEHVEGELHVANNLVVASTGIVPAEYVQSGGTTTIGGRLDIGGTGGSVILHGGKLIAQTISSRGRLEIGNATLTVDQMMLAGTFVADRDSANQIHFKGAGLTLADDAFTSDFRDRSGLANSELVFDAGPDRVSKFSYGELQTESGAISVAENQLRIRKIQVGGDSPSTLRFESEYNWGLDFAVETLELSPGSVLELDGTNLNYEELILGEGAQILNADCNDDRYVDAADLRCVASVTVDYVTDRLRVTPGDFNADGKVDFADFTVLSSNFSREGVDYTHGDADADGVVAFADFLVLSQNYGAVSGWDRSSELAAVPEPCSLIPLFVGLLLTVSQIRSRN